MELRSGSTLEIASITGNLSDYQLVRCFAVYDGDALMEETLFLEGHEERYHLFTIINQECTGLIELEKGRWLAVGSFGDLHFIEDGHVRSVSAEPDDPRFLTSVRLFDGPDILATGLGGTLLRLVGENWQNIVPDIEADLYDVDRAADGTIWFVGSDGFVGSVQGGTTTIHDMPTDVDLNSLACLVGDALLVGGASGTILLGDGQRWRNLSIDSGEDVTSVRRWHDTAFLAAGNAVLRLDGDNIVEDGSFGATDLQIAGGLIWSLDVEGVRVREGTAWREVAVSVDLPDSGPMGRRLKS